VVVLACWWSRRLKLRYQSRGLPGSAVSSEWLSVPNPGDRCTVNTLVYVMKLSILFVGFLSQLFMLVVYFYLQTLPVS